MVSSLFTIQYHKFTIHQGAHDAALGALMTMFRMLMGESYSPMEIHCFYARPATAIRFEHDVRCPILYDMPDNKVLFDNADLHRRLASANSELQKINEDLLLEKLHQLDRACMVTRVTLAINKELPTGEVYEKDIAASLGVSLRTMQRQLAEQQQSFKQLLDLRFDNSWPSNTWPTASCHSMKLLTYWALPIRLTLPAPLNAGMECRPVATVSSG